MTFPKFKYKKWLIFVFYLVWVFPLQADLIVLRNGNYIEGRIISQSRSAVVIETPDGIRNVSKSEIRRILHGSRAEEELERITAPPARPPERRPEPVPAPEVIEEEIEEVEPVETEPVEIEPIEEPIEIQPLIPEPIDPDPFELPTEIQPVEDTPPSPMPGTSQWGAVWRSAVLPGWGQMYSGKPVAGIMYSSLFLGAGYGAYESNRLQRNAMRDYENLFYSDPLDPINLIFPGATPENLLFSPDPGLEQLVYQSQQFRYQRSAVDRHAGLRDSFAAAAGFIYLANIADAYFLPENTPRNVNRMSALWRSAVFPGWGQFYAGRTSEGLIYAMAFTGTAYGAYESNRLYMNAIHDYDELLNPDPFDPVNLLFPEQNPVNFLVPTQITPAVFAYQEDLFRRQISAIDRHQSMRDNFSLALGAIYLLNLADAYFFTGSASYSLHMQPTMQANRGQSADSLRIDGGNLRVSIEF